MTYKNNPYLIAAIAFFIVPLSGVSIDIYVPSLPAVARYFATDKSLAQLTITFYMLGFGFMQLFAGSISDSFGRKIPCLIGLSLYITSVFLIPFSPHMDFLLILRLLQGIAMALVAVPLRSVIPDLFTDREMAKMVNYLTMSWSMGPVVAPAIGGYLQHYFGWQANFYFLFGYSFIAILFVLFFLPETSQYRHPFEIKKSIQRYRDILSCWEYVHGVMTNALMYSIVILFAVVAPFLIQNVLHYSPIKFGNMALLMGAAWFIGALTNRFLLDMDVFLKTNICLFLMLFITFFMLLIAFFLPLHIITMMVPLLFLTWLGGILFPTYALVTIKLFPTMTASANALFGSVIFLVSGIVSAIGTLLKSTATLPLMTAYLVLVLLALLMHFLKTVRK